jgi:hypothetical protein
MPRPSFTIKDVSPCNTVQLAGDPDRCFHQAVVKRHPSRRFKHTLFYEETGHKTQDTFSFNILNFDYS